MDQTAGPSSSKSVRGSNRLCRLLLNDKKMILRVFHCLARDHSLEKDELVEMCSDYTGVSKTTVYGILREEKKHGEVRAPRVSTGRKKIEIDEDAKYAIRRTMHNFLFNKELLTIDLLLEAISKEEIIPKMSKNTLRLHLRSMNFKFERVDRRHRLVETKESDSMEKKLSREIKELE